MKKEFNIICPKCGSHFTLMLTEKCFQRGTYRKFCSTKCSHSRTFSKETKRKMSEAKMGRIPWNKGMSLKNGDELKYAKPRSIETKRKMSKAQKGIKPSESAKRKMSETKLGKKMSIEFKKKRSEYMTKNNPMKGKTHSDSVKKKLSECMKKRWNNPKYRNFMSNVMKKRVKSGDLKIFPNYNRRSIEFFKQLDKKFSLNGYYATKNDGEFHIPDTKYWVDYYEPTLNLVIEWDEPQHFDGEKLKEKDIIRENIIKDKLNCTIIRIKETQDMNVRDIRSNINEKIRIKTNN